MDIREIENIIDNLHDGHSTFSGTKEQLTYELLSVFEDLCSIVVMDNIGVRPHKEYIRKKGAYEDIYCKFRRTLKYGN